VPRDDPDIPLEGPGTTLIFFWKLREPRDDPDIHKNPLDFDQLSAQIQRISTQIHKIPLDFDNNQTKSSGFDKNPQTPSGF